MLGTTSSSSSSSDFFEDNRPNNSSNLTKMTMNSNNIPEFVKKLFGMLEENSYPDVFSWGVNGDTFVVKDTNEFARHILPKHFKHSNFQSFVRQLNKYDFHKLKLPDEAQRIYGEQAWEFQHPNFKYNRRELLEGIKRKPTGKPGSLFSSASSKAAAASSYSALTSSLEEIKKLTKSLQKEIIELDKSQKKITSKLDVFNEKYSVILGTIKSSENDMRHQDRLMEDILEYFKEANHNNDSQNSNVYEKVEAILLSYQNLSSACEKQLERFASIVSSRTTIEFPNKRQKQQHYPLHRKHHQQQLPLASKNSYISPDNSILDPTNSAAIAVNSTDVPTVSSNATTILPNSELINANNSKFVHPAPMTVKSDHHRYQQQHSQMKPVTIDKCHNDIKGTASVHKTITKAAIKGTAITPTSTVSNDAAIPVINAMKSASVSTASTSLPSNNNTSSISRKRKRLHVGWSVPPRVLLVDDDSLFRRLSTRLLQIAGCTIDVAVDGMEAVRKLGVGKYDLVLMDIMMPRLDGISATRNIRQYDTWTPIISMTSNITEQDIQQYFMSGMTDVLPKPFNQGSLGTLLERYCAHLVVRRQHQQQLHLLQQNYSLGNAYHHQQLQLLDEVDNNSKTEASVSNNDEVINLTATSSSRDANTIAAASAAQALLSTVLYSIPIMGNSDVSLDTSATTTPIITPIDNSATSATADDLTVLQNAAVTATTIIPQASNASTASSATSELSKSSIPTAINAITNATTVTAPFSLATGQQQQWLAHQANQQKRLKLDSAHSSF
ncbi:hypothetical protein BDF20DRAFT_913177 [Mycotypha africana]|uniref:uncharacterized protein n=1 Tax=Mycotypha africana TaxID=64632 RepID=UPI0022FFEBC2|nr:uncharacterized protein BDF20DRAFT_913177 [Mycotypha africana]KAI8979637.1 hypothetical protein BDF20DRAFT_913177 [Mycotypha africana]